MKAKVQKRICVAITAIGLALLIMMVTMEGEPGALPLALILLGGIGYVSALWREKKID